MSTKDNGGPAFPNMPPQDTATGSAAGYPYPDAGMTLRDYFAAKAMPALLAVCQQDGRDPGTSYVEHCAGMAYTVADAMIKARAA